MLLLERLARLKQEYGGGVPQSKPVEHDQRVARDERGLRGGCMRTLECPLRTEKRPDARSDCTEGSCGCRRREWFDMHEGLTFYS